MNSFKCVEWFISSKKRFHIPFKRIWHFQVVGFFLKKIFLLESWEGEKLPMIMGWRVGYFLITCGAWEMEAEGFLAKLARPTPRTARTRESWRWTGSVFEKTCDRGRNVNVKDGRMTKETKQKRTKGVDAQMSGLKGWDFFMLWFRKRIGGPYLRQFVWEMYSTQRCWFVSETFQMGFSYAHCEAWISFYTERQILSCILRQCSERLGITLTPGGVQGELGFGGVIVT